ncbi:MAG: hypothetical protein ACI8QZ_000949 [Chlamydiales bacterium]|jgi:hypothetical protein
MDASAPRPVVRAVERRRTWLAGLILCLGGCGTEPAAPDSSQAGAHAGAQDVHGGRDNSDWARGVEGFWTVDRRAAGTEEERRAAAALEGIGYAGAFEAAPAASGVILHDPQRVQAGLNLYTSGHAPEASLIDMQGSVLHTWRLDYGAIPAAPAAENPMTSGAWRRAALLPDGSLLALFEGLLLVKVDRDSNLVWQFDGNPHHDLELQPDGTIYVLTRRSVFRRGLHPERPILEDFVSVLDDDGRELRRVSLIECFRNSDFREILSGRPRRAGDIFHTNTIEVLDGRLSDRSSAFRAGNVLLSFRHLNAIAVVDLDQKRVVWAVQGPWVAQHQPTVLENGNLMLFDNSGYGGSSQIIEFDPLSLEQVWTYRADPPEDFFSVYCGSNQRFGNGNTLISDSCSGRAFEVTDAGEIVWEFINPHHGGEHGELIAALFEMVRFPEASLSWLDGR